MSKIYIDVYVEESMGSESIDFLKNSTDSDPIDSAGPVDFYHQILMALGYSVQDAPVAEWLRCYHGLPNGHWQVVTPLHWEAGHQDVCVDAVGEALLRDEAQARLIFSRLAAWAEEQGMQLHYHNAHTWLLESGPMRFPHAISAYQLLGRSMRPALDALKGSQQWLRWLTESQMLLAQVVSSVNGIWVWGGAEIPALKPKARRVVVCGSESWLQAIRRVTSRCERFDETKPSRFGDVYLVPDASWLDTFDLKNHLRHKQVRWHWKDHQQILPSDRWFVRMWFKKGN